MNSNPWAALIVFVLVIACIPLALRALKRFGLAPQMGGSVLRTVAMLPMGNAQRVVVVELQQGDRPLWLVLGQGSAGVTLLTQLEAPMDALSAPPVVSAPTHARTVQQLIEKWRHGTQTGTRS